VKEQGGDPKGRPLSRPELTVVGMSESANGQFYYRDLLAEILHGALEYPAWGGRRPPQTRFEPRGGRSDTFKCQRQIDHVRAAASSADARVDGGKAGAESDGPFAASGVLAQAGHGARAILRSHVQLNQHSIRQTQVEGNETPIGEYKPDRVEPSDLSPLLEPGAECVVTAPREPEWWFWVEAFASRAT
jgi:hypothetical protein